MLRRVLFAVALLTISVACGGSNDDNGSSVPTSAAFKTPVIDCETTTVQLMLGGGAALQYTAEVVEGAEWCTFAQGAATRKGAMEAIVFMHTARNTSSQARTARVTVDFSNNDHYEVSLTQQAYTSSALFDRGWAEQPFYQENGDYLYVTHYAALNDRTVRSYSFCFDVTKRGSRWVAYPLHECYYKPNVGREDAWAYDPSVPQNYQGYILSGYGMGGYDRGHQLPSADRVATRELNQQTFYSTNMTPQLSDFNQKYWANLENRVRGWVCSDTLYVVTGAHYGDQKFRQDRQGNAIGIPTHYYKLLLRTVKGNTHKRIQDCRADELQAIGFWLDHRANSGSPSSKECRSVAEIEALTGFTFFRNLPEEAAAEVKAQNDPSKWSIQ